MKPAQLIAAVVVLALLVFGITFALTYVGMPGKPPESDGEPAKLEEAKLSFVATSQTPIVVEFLKEGSVDFWFRNENAKPVVAGLLKTSCECSGGKIYLLPVGSTMSPGQESVLEKTATETTLVLNGKDGVTVQPNQVGWVRLQWSGRNEKKSFKLTLWLNARDSGTTQELETFVQFCPSYQVQAQSMPFDANDASNLPRTEALLCWSSTRRELGLTAEFVGPKGENDPLTIERVERIDEKDYPALAQRLREVNLLIGEANVLSAYRVLVTLRGVVGKTLIDAGPFNREMDLNLAEYAGEALKIRVHGSIASDVQVIGLTEGRIDFSSFKSKQGAEHKLTLQSSTPGLELEVDERTAKFLDVKPPKKQPGAEPTWEMIVKIKRGEVTGRFPRDQPEKYRDSAIYLRPVRPKNEPPARATRIPVVGAATSE